MLPAEDIARQFHEVYESLAPHFAYETREESAKPWRDVPEPNKMLMVSVVAALLARGAIKPGDPPTRGG
jgi:hypothetical protein